MEFTKQEYLSTYGELYFARAFELKTEELALQGKLAGFFHLTLGAEAIMVGAHSELGPNDWLQPHFRGHPLFALQLGINEFTAEMLGKQKGTYNGLAGAAHLFSKSKKMGPYCGMLGYYQTMAAGVAFAYKVDKVDGCVVMLAGDGTMNEGVVSEVLNLMAIWKLPVAWFIQDNKYAISTKTSDTLGIDKVAERAKGFGLPYNTVDGNNVYEVKAVMREAIIKARKGEPSITAFESTRWKGHFIGDPDFYRDQDEVQKAIEKTDPLKLAQQTLLKGGHATETELRAIEAEQDEIIRKAFEYGMNSPAKTWEDVNNPALVYAD